MLRYTPDDWYWLVGADTERVYSSARATYVPISDPAYRAWGAGGSRQPTRIPSEEELHDVLTAVSIAPPPGMGTTAQQAQATLSSGTVELTCAATPALNGTYDIGVGAQQEIIALQTAVQAGVAGDHIPYPDAAGTEHVFTSAQFTAFAAEVFRYVLTLKRCARGSVSELPSPDLAI